MPRGTNSSSRSWASRLDLWILIFVWMLAAVYTGRNLDQGWVPHDEGALAQSAERVLHGEIPHQDFDEIYTGGLSFTNALAFRLLGTNLMSMRWVLFGVFLLWIPVLYYVARQFAGPLLSGLVTLLAVTWSIPNYSAAVPSWFNLFFAVFAVGALLRFLETQRRTWLVLAGVVTGLSVLAKIVGLYLFAGVLFTLTFFEQTEVVPENGAKGRRYSILISLAAAAFVAALVVLVERAPGPSQFFHFVLPVAAIAVCLVWSEWHGAGGPALFRIRRVLFHIAPFLAGVAIPIIVFLIPYLLNSSIADLLQGVFVIPARRFSDAAWPLPPLASTVFVLPLVFLLFLPRIPSRPIFYMTLGVVTFAMGYTLMASKQPVVAGTVWGSMRPLIPLASVVGVFLLLAPHDRAYGSRKLMAVIAVTVTAGLIQFPFSTPFYFLYVGPLVALVLTALVSFRPIAGPFYASVIAFYLIFAVVWLNTGHYDGGGDPHPRSVLTDRLNLERGRLRVAPEEARAYEELVKLVRSHNSSSYLLATPDCPEVYFLTGLRNPTRWIFEFLRARPMNTNRLLRTLEQHSVSVVVINEKPRFSGPLPADLRLALLQSFPESARIGKFTVRWAS